MGVIEATKGMRQGVNGAQTLLKGSGTHGGRHQHIAPRIQVAEALARAARARIPGAGLPPDPQVQLGWMNYDLPSFKPMEVVGMTQLQVMQMLPIAGKLGLSRSIARSP